MKREEALRELYQLVYDATSGSTPNLGGHHGFKGFESSFGIDFLDATAKFVRRSHSSPTKGAIAQYHAQCLVAQTMGIIDDKQIERLEELLDIIRT